MTRERVIVIVAAMGAVVQLASATVQRRDLRTMHTVVARNLVEDGRLSVAGWRAYVLPGEAMYLAAGFGLLPEALWRYLHVPVAVLLVTAVAAVAASLGGPLVGLAAGAVATLDPFLVAHGPIWDDTLLAAALEWFVFASLMGGLRPVGADAQPARTVPLALLTMAAGLAALTRMQSQLVLTFVALAAIGLRPLRQIRRPGWAVLVGVCLAVGAWGARNYAVLGSFEPGSSHDGKTLYESNCPHTRDGIRTLGVVGGFLEECSPAQLAHVVTLGELEADRQFRRYALAYMAANPADVAATSAFKLMVSLSGFDYRSPLWSLRNVVAVASSLVTLTVGVWGLVHLWRRAPRPAPAIALAVMAAASAATTLVLLLIGPTGLRYRISATGFLFVGVGAIVAQTLTRRGRDGEAAGALSRAMKRTFDAALAAAGLIGSLPLWIVLALAIKLEDGGAVFYGHERVGRDGVPFYVWKFRSMIPNAEAAVGPVQAHAGDPRVTRIGRWMRATALDELPQLWNIFRGDMSFVGPRALRPGEIEVQGDGRFERLEDVPGFARRCAVRPGLTGIAQIYAPRDIPRRQKFRYDAVYFRQQGLSLDLRLILLSFWITFRGQWESRGKKF